MAVGRAHAASRVNLHEEFEASVFLLLQEFES